MEAGIQGGYLKGRYLGWGCGVVWGRNMGLWGEDVESEWTKGAKRERVVEPLLTGEKVWEA